LHPVHTTISKALKKNNVDSSFAKVGRYSKMSLIYFNHLQE